MPQQINGTMVDPSQFVVGLAPAEGMLGIQVTCWPDPRAAPNPSAALQSMLVLALVNAQNAIASLIERVAVLEIVAAEGARPLAVHVRDNLDAIVGAEPPPNDRARDDGRHAVALAAVIARADTIGITAKAPPEPASALDGVTLD